MRDVGILRFSERVYCATVSTQHRKKSQNRAITKSEIIAVFVDKTKFFLPPHTLHLSPGLQF